MRVCDAGRQRGHAEQAVTVGRSQFKYGARAVTGDESWWKSGQCKNPYRTSTDGVDQKSNQVGPSARRTGDSRRCRHQCAGLHQTDGTNTRWRVLKQEKKKNKWAPTPPPPRRRASPQAQRSPADNVQPPVGRRPKRGHPAMMAHTERRAEPAATTLRDGSRQAARRAPSRTRPRWPMPAAAPPTPIKHAMVAVARRRRVKNRTTARCGGWGEARRGWAGTEQ